MNSALFVRLVARPSVTSFFQDCLIALFPDILHGVRFWVIFDENSCLKWVKWAILGPNLTCLIFSLTLLVLFSKIVPDDRHE